MIGLNWQIGRVLAERTDNARSGEKVIQRLSADLRAEFPDSRGFSPRNLNYMRSFARAWPGLTEIAQQAVAQLPWGHITVLLDKLSDQELRSNQPLAIASYDLLPPAEQAVLPSEAELQRALDDY